MFAWMKAGQISSICQYLETRPHLVLLTEFSYGRELLGSGADFSARTGIDDDTGIWLMRHLQYKIPMMSGLVDELLSGH